MSSIRRALTIRVRLTVAIAAALLFVLALLGLFVYLRVGSDLNNEIDDGLSSRAEALVTLLESGGDPKSVSLAAPPQAEQGFSQVLTPDGSLKASSRSIPAAIDPGTAARARGGRVVVERPVQGVGGATRILAVPAESPGGDRIVVVGASTANRTQALDRVAAAFLIGGPLAVVLAVGIGYLLSGQALAPVSRMRRRASEITLGRSGERLPLPDADDEIRRLGETLNTMLDRIEGLLQRERVFVADASHELRTPLSILRAELELAARPGRSPEELRRAIRSAANEAERLSRLADDLLVIARSDQGDLPIRRERVNVHELLQRVQRRFSIPAGDREISVHNPRGLEANVDPLRVEQALGNLVDNAIRHGGGPVSLAARTEDGLLVLDVADGGPGFPEGFGPTAFNRFTRADEGRTSGGAGLGLAIVLAIARAHGGTARVVDAEPPGVTVQISLPRRG